ncbi:MAG: toxin-antitoxin system HicB family antitoxin [Streptosporangiales bacterium]|nr:toxin-antitoxin system HicB family antitoxin [Streptosporangiales bacterium]
MDLTPYVEKLRGELAVAAEAGGEEARALAERLTAPLDSATRLVLLEALADAAGEITSELAPGSVELRLRGREPDFAVTPPQDLAPASVAAGAERLGPEAGPPPAAAPPEGEDAGGTTRITLRLPEHLKPRIDEAAARAGLSVNAWLVRAVSAAVEPGGRTSGPVQDAGSVLGGRRYTGWVR